MSELSESQLLYLLTIDELSQTYPSVQRIQIAVALGYSKASVTHAMQVLEQLDMITIFGRNIQLSKKGQLVVLQANQRYDCIKKLLVEHQFTKLEAELYAKKLFYCMDEAFLQRLWDIHNTD